MATGVHVNADEDDCCQQETSVETGSEPNETSFSGFRGNFLILIVPILTTWQSAYRASVDFHFDHPTRRGKKNSGGFEERTLLKRL